MIEFIKGEIRDLNPTSVVLENMGMGYFVNISVNTYSDIQHQDKCCLYIHEVIREDVYLLYGFFSLKERDAFRKLIAVSGVGANTANVILSSMTVDELEACILSNNVAVLKNVKGIGTKTAQRIIVELKDKVEKSGLSTQNTVLDRIDNSVGEEAVAALQMLGFSRNPAEKVVRSVLWENSKLPVEDVIKAALKQL